MLIWDKNASVESLLAALNDENRDVRLNAAYSLGCAKAKEGVAALISRLKDSDRNVQEEAANALGKIGDARAVQPLMEALPMLSEQIKMIWKAPGGEGLWCSVVGALAAIGDAQAVPLLATVLGNSSESTHERRRHRLQNRGRDRSNILEQSGENRI